MDVTIFPVLIPSVLQKRQCVHFVRLDHLSPETRREAASWVIKRFEKNSVDIWTLGPENEPGFWFQYEKDVVLFTLRWI